MTDCRDFRSFYGNIFFFYFSFLFYSIFSIFYIIFDFDQSYFITICTTAFMPKLNKLIYKKTIKLNFY